MDTLANTDTSGIMNMADRMSYNIWVSVTVVFPDVNPKGGNCIDGSPGSAVPTCWITTDYCKFTHFGIINKSKKYGMDLNPTILLYEFQYIINCFLYFKRTITYYLFVIYKLYNTFSYIIY